MTESFDAREDSFPNKVPVNVSEGDLNLQDNNSALSKEKRVTYRAETICALLIGLERLTPEMECT